MAEYSTLREKIRAEKAARKFRADAFDAALGEASLAAQNAALRHQEQAPFLSPTSPVPEWYRPSCAIVWPGNAGSAFGRHLKSLGWEKSYNQPGLRFRVRRSTPTESLVYGEAFIDSLNRYLPMFGVEKRAYAILLDY